MTLAPPVPGPGPATATPATPPGPTAVATHRRAPRGEGWPLTALLLGYPLWWSLGLGTLIFPVAAVPMAWLLVRRRARGQPVRVPPGFALWLLFLAVSVAGIAVLGVNPPGTVPGTVAARLPVVAFRLVAYASLTVLLLYAGNLTGPGYPRRRLVTLLAYLFGVTVAGGLLGVLDGGFSFTAPLELVLPPRLRADPYVQSLVHPAAAQVMNVLGHPGARPAAPWGYTNTWGNNLCLLAGWFVVATFGAPARRRVRVLAVATLAVAAVPVVYSLNRGLWIGLGVAVVVTAVRLAARGRLWALGVLGLAAAVLAGALAVSPLGTVVAQRLDNGRSNGVRLYLTRHALGGLAVSPVIGLGSTRNTLGGRQSITVGPSRGCPRCGNFTIGGNGQLWQLVYANGIAGTAGYVGFFLVGLWRFRRGQGAAGIAGTAAIACSLVASLWYNALATPLALTLLGYAVLWRGALEGPHRTVPCGRSGTEGGTG